MSKILILEDEESIRSFVVLNLNRQGFNVLQAEAGEEALRLAALHPDIDIALLDVMVPGIDGFEVCRRIRETNEGMGIIFLTARVQEQDKVHGLSLGADDHIGKPFSPAELMARISSLLRRVHLYRKSNEPASAVLRSGVFELDLTVKELRKQGMSIELTPTEMAVMHLFMEHDGIPLSRDQLLDHVWGVNYVGDPKIVDVNIRRIRQKIEADPARPSHIETVWGFGYKWKGALP